MVSVELRRVRIGLNTIFYGALVSFIAFVASFLFAMLLGFGGATILLGSVLILMTLGVLGGYFAIFIGQLYCCSAPVESNARAAVRYSTSLHAAQFFLTVFGMIFPYESYLRFSFLEFALTHAPVLVAFLAAILFGVFLKRLNESRTQSSLARSSKTVILFVSLLLGGYVLFVVGSFLTVSAPISVSFAMLGIPILVMFLLGLTTFAKYINLVRLTALSIGREPILEQA
ncbi:MAG: hypothetical protein AAF802_20320 [Planctomycetota bacterium]